jgi:hypothetical protein
MPEIFVDRQRKNQCDGVILMGAPFSPTHSPASGDQ